jgi:peptidoglycan/LPS O-acetylase OafA/YrhL
MEYMQMENGGVIKSLTSLRFFAAMAIVIHHSSGYFFPTEVLKRIPLAVGVSFFFVLSGFILSYVYSETMKSVGPYKFYTSRFARIWPAHIFTMLLVMILITSEQWVLGSPNGWLIGIMNASLLHSIVPVPAYYFSFNGVSWSISTEAFFYLAFPLLLVSMEKTWHLKAIGLLVLGFGCTYFVEGLGLTYYPREALTSYSGHGISYISPLGRIQEFFIGMLAFRVFLRVKDKKYIGFKSNTFFEVLSVCVVLLYTRQVLDWAYSLAGSNESPVGELIGNCANGLMFGFLIICFAVNRGALSRFLSMRFFVLLGEISFSMYMLHQVVIRFYGINKHMFDFIPDYLMFPLVLVFVVIAAYFMWRFVEIPAQKHLKRFFAWIGEILNARKSAALS